MRTLLPITIILLLAHAPFLVQYAKLIAEDSWYFVASFVPSITFVLWAIRDGGREGERKPTTPWHLILIVAGLVTAAVTGEPQFAMFGLIVLLHGILRSRADRQVHSDLGYLCWIPLVCIQPPYGWHEWTVGRMTAASTRLAGWMLDQQQIIHLRTSDSIELLGHRFTDDVVCGGLTSAVVFVALCAVILSVLRRAWLHTLPLLLFATCLAVVMNALKYFWLASTWDSSTQVDLAFVNTATFAASLFAFLLWDVFVSSLTDWVPIMTGMLPNPLAVAFDKCFVKPPRVVLSEEQIEDGELTGIPSWSEVRECLNDNLDEPITISGILHWVREFTMTWTLTRSPRKMIIGILVVFIFAIVANTWNKAPSAEETLIRYELALTQSKAEEKDELSELLMTRILQKHSNNMDLRHELVLLLVANDKLNSAEPHIRRLTSVDFPGNPETRVWLVRQAKEPQPLLPLSLEERLQQLRLADQESNEQDAQVHRLLAEDYVRQRQFGLAEHHLTIASKIDPGHLPSLLVLQQSLGRTPDQLISADDAFVTQLRTQLDQDGSDKKIRIALAQLLAMRHQLDEAETLLTDTAVDPEDPELRNVLAQIYAQDAIQRVRLSPLNSQFAGNLIVKAIQLTPSNRQLLQLAVQYSAMGAKYQIEDLQPALDAVFDGSMTESDHALMVQALEASGQSERAVEYLKPLVTDVPGARPILVRLLKKTERDSEATALAEQALKEYAPNAESSPEAILQHVDLLLADSRYQEARVLLQQREQNFADATAKQQSLGRKQLAHACLGIFDSMPADEPIYGATAIELLTEAMNTNAMNTAVINRLAGLSVAGDSQTSKEAQELLNSLLAGGKATADIYQQLGAQALQHDQPEKGRRYLERANSLAPNNPIVMNNLATALVRGDNIDTERALQISEETLKILPGNPYALSTRGEVHVARKDWESARQDLEASLPALPEIASIRRLLIEVYSALGETDLATEQQKELERITQLQTD